MDPLVKNLWLTLTLALPGLVTYGTWRIIIILIGYKGIDFTGIDDSTILTLSVLFAIALLQQAIGITIEALLTLFFKITKSKFPNGYQLFIGRFKALAQSTHNEDVKRTIGQFFLSLNLTVGQGLIFVFYSFAANPEGMEKVTKYTWLCHILIFVLCIVTIVTIFRFINSLQVIRHSKE